MARISRVVDSGYPHHVTQRGVRSLPIFQTDSDRAAYLGFMAEELERFGVELLVWCLMTNHTHLIVVPKDSTFMARAIGEAHRRYTRMKNFSDGVRGDLFQGRFASRVSDDRHLIAAARYVELNPVNAGMVKEAVDYPWFSARFHLRASQRDRLARDRTLLGLVDDWGEYLKGRDEAEGQETLSRGLRTGRPAGNESFVESIERLTGRDLARRKAGRPQRRASREISMMSLYFCISPDEK